MRKSLPPQSSNWNSDINEDLTNLGSQSTSMRKSKEKKKQQGGRNSQLFEINNTEMSLRNIDIADTSEKAVPTNRRNRKKESEMSSDGIRKKTLRKLANVTSIDLGESTDIMSESKSMDVVVDIHRECKEYRGENTENIKTLDEGVTDKSLHHSESFKVFSKRSVLDDKTSERTEVNLNKTQRQKNMHKDIEITDSLDLIEEFQESPNIKATSNKIVQSATTRKSLKGNVVQSPVKGKSHIRRQWDLPENINQTEECKKPPRKRWSKDTTVIRLPETRSVSSTSSSIENVSSLAQDSAKKPVPTLRTSVKKESFFSYDNAAFVSENEEILRIETDHRRESTRIEMRKITDQIEDAELSSLSNHTLLDSANEKEVQRRTLITVDKSREFKESSARSFGKRRKSRILSIENSEDSDSNTVLSRDRVTRRSSNKDKNQEELNNSSMSQSLEEITKQSNGETSDEESIGTSRFETDKNNKKTKRRQNSIRDTLSTNEDDDVDEDRLTSTHFDDDLQKQASGKLKKSTLQVDQDQQRRKKEKKRCRRKSEASSPVRSQQSNVEKDVKKKKKKKQRNEREKEIKYISITIHRADMLEIDYVTKHPMVKVHIVEIESGKYLKSVDENSASTYLQPVISGKFDFREHRSMIPVWEEELIFEYDFDTILKTEGERIVIFFEIIDLLSFSEASFNYDKFGNEGCWYKVAWAFLKPVGKNNTLHTDKRVRLQLYRPQRNSKRFQNHKCEVYAWWKSNIRTKYPSSLFVTVTSTDPPKLEPVFYQQLSLYDLSDTRNEPQKESTHKSDTINLPKWTRLAAQSCKIPNENFFETEISENGSFFVAFSNGGKHLACVLSEEYDYPIVVYEVEAKKIHVRFTGHKTFVYSLNWSSSDDYLLSVSSDQTARIWDVRNQIVQYIEMMPHPSYVYSGKFDPSNESIVATGCYDKVSRIWIKDKKSKNRDLSQELEGHEGFVNSICFQKDGNLLTADSVGIIIIWFVKKNRRLPSKKEWHISRKIKVREIEGVIINTIVLHPLESRLLVHSRNNGLRLLDLATGVVLQKYAELTNQRIQSTACISPCGGLILCGGEDSSLNIWSLETGKYLAKYTIDRNFRAVTCVDYHPYNHMLVFSTFGSPAPVRVLKFNKDATGENIGLRMMEMSENRVHNNVSMSLLNTTLTSRKNSRGNNKRTPEQLLKDKNQSVQSFRSFSCELMADKTPVGKDERHGNTKFKFQRLNESEQTLKNRSTSRLYNIIEKIDRILSNTSRSSDDLESGQMSTFVQERTRIDNLESNDKEGLVEEKRKSRKSKASIYSSIEDHSSSYFGSSTTSSNKNQVLELKTIQDIGIYDPKTKKRSKSAKELKTTRIVEDELSKTFSDSAANSRKFQVYDEIMKTMDQKHMESSFINQMKGDGPQCVNISNAVCLESDHSSSPGSTGTYVVEKADVERNKDRHVGKVSGDEASVYLDKSNELDLRKRSDSEGSVLSNVTFTVENEIPVPKPRRKRNVT